MSKRNNYKKKLSEHQSKAEGPKESRSPFDRVMILKFEEGRPSNLSKFKKWIGPQCVAKFGDLGLLIDRGDLPQIEPLEAPDATDLDDAHDPHGFVKAAHMSKIKFCESKLAKLEENQLPMYNCIWAHLSDESKDRLSRQAGWAQVEDERDVVALWLNIGITHSGAGMAEPILDRKMARKYYAELRQRRDEPILKFRKRFEEAVAALETSAEEEMPDDQQAVDFIDKLDDTRFGQFKVDLENDLLKGMEYPDTLESAHRRASDYKRLEFALRRRE